jgi:hypothetical protein
MHRAGRERLFVDEALAQAKHDYLVINKDGKLFNPARVWDVK